MSLANVLSISCKDQPGLIAKVTSLLYQHQLNIIQNAEFVENAQKHFFMRTVFSGDIVAEVLVNALASQLPEGAEIKLSKNGKKKILVLASKEQHCLSDLLIRNHFNEMNASIMAVISNHNNLQPLVEKFELPFYCISHINKSREEQEQEVINTIDSYSPDYIVLAKYMRILSPAFVEKYRNRIINIHHSFLPAFIGANPYAQAYTRGVKIIGATAHFVNDLLDEGPIIAQQVISVNHSNSAKEMSDKGKEIEKMVLAQALSLVFNEKLFIYGNKTIVFE